MPHVGPYASSVTRLHSWQVADGPGSETLALKSNKGCYACTGRTCRRRKGLNGTIHSARLFGCHVGKGSCDKLGRPRRLALAGEPRSNAKAGEPTLANRRVYQNVGGFDVLMDKTALMQVTNRGGQTNGHTQRKRHVQWLTEQLIERYSAGSSETRTGRSQWRAIATGRTAHVEFSSSLREYSCSSRFRISGAGYSARGESRRT
jgi:hypothetical protein